MEVSSQSHDFSACYLTKNIIANDQETMRPQGPVWIFWRRVKTSYPLPGFETRITQLLASSPKLLRYPDPDVTFDTSINVNGYKCDKSIGTVSRYDIKESR
jgi:hypothetical protein